MPRLLRGGLDVVSWPPSPAIDATVPRNITLVGWANNWRSNSINDRILIHKADSNHQRGEFATFLGTFDPSAGSNPNQNFDFWHNPWTISEGKWSFKCPGDDLWHMFSVRYRPISLIEMPDVRFDLQPAAFVPGISHQPAGQFNTEVSAFSFNPAPYNLDLGNTLNSGFSSYNGAFWRFAWWNEYINDQELFELWGGKRPNLIKFQNLLFYSELEGGTSEVDEGFYKMGTANITGTSKSLDAPYVYNTPGVGKRTLRRPYLFKGFSPPGNVTIAGQAITTSAGVLTPLNATKPLTGVSLTLQQGAVRPRVGPVLAGQQINLGQGSAGPLTGPKQFSLTGQSITIGEGNVTPEIAEPLPGMGITIGQAGVSIGGTAIISIIGQQMSTGIGSVAAGPAPMLKGLPIELALGQMYLDEQVEYVKQSWTKIEGPP